MFESVIDPLPPEGTVCTRNFSDGMIAFDFKNSFEPSAGGGEKSDLGPTIPQIARSIARGHPLVHRRIIVYQAHNNLQL
jgi:hypothetical protein